MRFDPSLPMVSLDLSRVAENSTLISVLMTCSSAWMESALADPAGGQRWVIYDEAWRLMAYPALLRRMDAQWRLARHFGIANMLIFHKLSDLDNVGDSGSAMRALASSLLANAETRIVYRQEPDQLGSTALALGLTRTEQNLLPALGTGQGLWRVKDRSFVVQHQLHPDELAAFDTTARMTGIRAMSAPSQKGMPGDELDECDDRAPDRRSRDCTPASWRGLRGCVAHRHPATHRGRGGRALPSYSLRAILAGALGCAGTQSRRYWISAA